MQTDKMKLFSLLTVLFLLISISSQAQTKFGLSAGYVSSYQTISNPNVASVRAFDSWAVESKSTQLSGIAFTIDLDHQLNTKWNFRAGIGYVQKGQIEEIVNQEPGGKRYTAAAYKDELNYINIPARFNYSLFRKNDFSISVGAGMYLGFGVDGKTSQKIFEHTYSLFYTPPQEYQGRVHFKSSMSSRDDYPDEDIVVKPLDLGLVTGFAMTIKNFEFFFDYQLGLNDVHAKIDTVRPNSNDEYSNARIKCNRSLITGVRFWLFNLK
ncbi:MAG: porin family protein [Flammeovirgaceae bacterium]